MKPPQLVDVSRCQQFELLEEELLIIRQLNHQGHIESLLQPLGEEERHQMPQVQGLGGRPSSSVDVEGLTLPGLNWVEPKEFNGFFPQGAYGSISVR